MLNVPKQIIIHGTDVSYTKNADQFAAVNVYHRAEGFLRSSLGFFVGYHRLITGGKNYKAKEDSEEGCHCNQLYKDGQSLNVRSLGICVGFDGDLEQMPNDLYEILREQILVWMDTYRIAPADVLFHRHYNTAKTCPGSLLYQNWLGRLTAPETRPQTAPQTSAPKPPEQCAKQEAIIAVQTQTLSLWQQLWALIK